MIEYENNHFFQSKYNLYKKIYSDTENKAVKKEEIVLDSIPQKSEPKEMSEAVSKSENSENAPALPPRPKVFD